INKKPRTHGLAAVCCTARLTPSAGRARQRKIKMSGVEEGGGEPSSGSTPDKRTWSVIHRIQALNRQVTSAKLCSLGRIASVKSIDRYRDFSTLNSCAD